MHTIIEHIKSFTSIIIIICSITMYLYIICKWLIPFLLMSGHLLQSFLTSFSIYNQKPYPFPEYTNFRWGYQRLPSRQTCSFHMSFSPFASTSSYRPHDPPLPIGIPLKWPSFQIEGFLWLILRRTDSLNEHQWFLRYNSDKRKILMRMEFMLKNEITIKKGISLSSDQFHSG